MTSALDRSCSRSSASTLRRSRSGGYTRVVKAGVRRGRQRPDGDPRDSRRVRGSVSVLRAMRRRRRWRRVSCGRSRRRGRAGRGRARRRRRRGLAASSPLSVRSEPQRPLGFRWFKPTVVRFDPSRGRRHMTDAQRPTCSEVPRSISPNEWLEADRRNARAIAQVFFTGDKHLSAQRNPRPRPRTAKRSPSATPRCIERCGCSRMCSLAEEHQVRGEPRRATSQRTMGEHHDHLICVDVRHAIVEFEQPDDRANVQERVARQSWLRGGVSPA